MPKHNLIGNDATTRLQCALASDERARDSTLKTARAGAAGDRGEEKSLTALRNLEKLQLQTGRKSRVTARDEEEAANNIINIAERERQ